ncbi:hypothetical protein, partial [Weizmannia sp. CD-2023]|uniref:hypothetical protein n=1 Tax=Weizmannia sp. CD-2023 TaxID=3037263 RepID=UPI002DBF3DA4
KQEPGDADFSSSQATRRGSIDPNDPKTIIREHREASKSELVFRASPEYKILYSLVNEQQNELEIDIHFGFKLIIRGGYAV